MPVKSTPFTREGIHPTAKAPSEYGIHGKVVWESGTPANDIPLALIDPDKEEVIALTSTGATGSYQLHLPTSYAASPPVECFDVLCLGYSILEPEPADAVPSTPESELNLTISSGQWLEIEVVDANSSHPLPGIHVVGTCSLDQEHDLFAQSNHLGRLRFAIPHAGPWSFALYAGAFDGPPIGLDADLWVDANVTFFRIRALLPPSSLHLLAHDAVDGHTLAEAQFRAAQEPEDVRYLPWQGCAEFPQTLPQQGGELQVKLKKPGRAFLAVSAPGYLPEVVEWIQQTPIPQSVPLIPLRPVPIEVTRQGKPLATQVWIAYSRRSKPIPADGKSEQCALNPQCGPRMAFSTDSKGQCTLPLPVASASSAPSSFDLWIANGEERKYFGVLEIEAMPSPPWRFEVQPPTGSLSFRLEDSQGQGIGQRRFQVIAHCDLSIQDSALQANDGIQKRIMRTNADGEFQLQLPAPCQVEIIPAGFSHAKTPPLTGQILPGKFLRLKKVEAGSRLERESLRNTTGHVIFVDGRDFSQEFRTLLLCAQSLKDETITQLTPIGEDGSFQFSLPVGAYHIFVFSETHRRAVEAGHYLECQAGEQGLSLKIPAPSGVRIQAFAQEGGQAIALAQVQLWDEKGPIFGEVYWKSGEVSHLQIFSNSIRYKIQEEGYGTLIGSALLNPGEIANVRVFLQPGRTIQFLGPSTEPNANEELLWISNEWPEGLPIPLKDGYWQDAPSSSLHLQWTRGKLTQDMQIGGGKEPLQLTWEESS